MRYIALLLVAHLLAAAVSSAQESSPSDPFATAPPAAPAVATHSYVVQLTEFRLESSADPKVTAGDIVQSFEQLCKDGKVDLVEIVRLSALEGQENSVQIGKLASVIVATDVGVPGERSVTRRVQTKQDIGTSVSVMVVPQGGKTLLKLSYEASRFEGEAEKDGLPDVVTLQFHTTLLIEPGKPTLVGGSSAEGSHLLMISIGE